MSKREELAKLTSDFYTKGPTLLKEALIELMEEKGWEGIFVTGWAPYFNDGDACGFGIHSCGPIKQSAEQVENNENENENEDSYYDEYWNKEISNLLDDTLIKSLFNEKEGRLTLDKTGKVKIEYLSKLLCVRL